MVFGLSAFRMKQLAFPLARWGAAAGSIGVFLLYEEVPQLQPLKGLRVLRVPRTDFLHGALPRLVLLLVEE